MSSVRSRLNPAAQPTTTSALPPSALPFTGLTVVVSPMPQVPVQLEYRSPLATLALLVQDWPVEPAVQPVLIGTSVDLMFAQNVRTHIWTIVWPVLQQLAPHVLIVQGRCCLLTVKDARLPAVPSLTV